MTVLDLSPIEDRDGWIGGIESIVVDGRRWYFGFDYSSDLVLSPLIDDETTMSLFASRHMSQRDGAHDAAFWRELVAGSVTTSDLTDDAQDREYTSERLATQRLTPRYYLSYLLGAAAGWPDEPETRPACSRNRHRNEPFARPAQQCRVRAAAQPCAAERIRRRFDSPLPSDH